MAKQLTNEEILGFRERFKKSMPYMATTLLGSAVPQTIPEFHKQIYLKLHDRKLTQVLETAPRGTAKSTVVSIIFPIWRVLTKRKDEDVFILIISESQAQSINFLNRIKYHLGKSHLMKRIYGDYGEATAKRWRDDDVILHDGTQAILRVFISCVLNPETINLCSILVLFTPFDIGYAFC